MAVGVSEIDRHSSWVGNSLESRTASAMVAAMVSAVVLADGIGDRVGDGQGDDVGGGAVDGASGGNRRLCRWWPGWPVDVRRRSRN